MKTQVLRTTVLLVAVVLLGTASAQDLVVLHSNDSHGQLFSSDGSESGETGGMARVATVISRTRQECPGRVIVLHAGDVLSRGDALTCATRGKANFRLMKRIGYDVFTPGNGDFYTGADNLLQLQRYSHLKFVKADIEFKSDGRLLFDPYVVRKVNGVRVGILGLGLVRTEHYAAAPLRLEDPVATATRWIPIIEKEADIVVVLSHLGFPADQKLAAAVPGIDLIVGGHTHTELQEAVSVPRPDGHGDVYIAQAGDMDLFVGRLDITLERAEGDCRIKTLSSRLLPLDAGVPQDPKVQSALARGMRDLEEVLCTRETELAWVEKGSSPAKAWAAEVIRDAAGSDLVLLEESAVCAPIPAGAVTLADVYRIHPYHNPLIRVRLTDAQIVALLRDHHEFIPAGAVPTAPSDTVRSVVFTGYAPSLAPELKALPTELTGLYLDGVLMKDLRSADGHDHPGRR